MPYTINVTRGTNNGTLTYTNGGVSVSTTCWWDPNQKIPANTYNGCSATTMSTKLNSQGSPREAIYIANVTGYSGIFIHMGTGPAWSDGCIVIDENDLLVIYNDIEPKNGNNVTVHVTG